MDAGRQRALVRKSTAMHKQQGQALGLTPTAAVKVVLKRKNDAKDDRPPKKETSLSVGERQQKALSPLPSPRHEV